ncbi:MAG: hypothetical protein EON60_02285 [Alphaproteobacteria bacterium]|nr:MAG: hypothetical protein EON60_02285 [Alphaproteobacteria bacterium]
MASKSKPTKTSNAKFPAKPVARPVADEPMVRRSTPVPTPAEIRAEQDAVTVDERIPLQGWAPAPRQMTWWERVRDRLLQRKEERAAMSEQMAAVKAGVLQELETMGVRKGVAVKGSPFATILLPTRPKKNFSKWWLVATAVVLLMGVMLWVGRGPEAPGAVLGQAVIAVRQHDLRAFETHVDVASVATSVVNQMFNVPSEGGLAARMTAFAKPGLADGLRDEILGAVGGEELDDSGNTLLGRLWHALGGDKLRVGPARVGMEDAHMAVGEVPLHRSDLGLTLPLQVLLTRDNEDDDWQVTDVPNLAAVLDTMGEAERVNAERKAVAAKEALSAEADVRVESVRKAKGANGHGSSNLMLSMILSNVGTQPARDVQLEVSFGDAAGQPMMTTRLTLDGKIDAGSRREQAWSVPIDRARAVERYVADLPLSALTVTVTVVE